MPITFDTHPSFTVEPPITDPPNSGPPPYNGPLIPVDAIYFMLPNIAQPPNCE